jgi:hypothetical protein
VGDQGIEGAAATECASSNDGKRDESNQGPWFATQSLEGAGPSEESEVGQANRGDVRIGGRFCSLGHEETQRVALCK